MAGMFPCAVGRMCRVLLLLPLSACSGEGWFGSPEEERLPGTRIALSGSAAEENAYRATDEARAALRPLGPTREITVWAQWGANETHAGGNLAGPRKPALLWATDLGAGSSDDAVITAPPVVADDMVYVLDAESALFAADIENGALLWETDLTPAGESGDEGFGGGLAFAGDRLFAATGFGEVVALDRTSGAVLWRTALPAPVRAPPLLGQGRIYVLDRANTVHALDRNNGAVRWQSVGPPTSLLPANPPGPAMSGNILVAPMSSGELRAYDAGTGRLLWSNPLDATAGEVALRAVWGGVALAGNGAFVANDSVIAAIELSSGRIAWQRPPGSSNPIWIVGQTLFVLTNDFRLMRLDAVNGGNTLWTQTLPQYDDEAEKTGRRFYFGPILVEGVLYIASSAGVLMRFDGETGERLDDIPLANGAATPPVAAGGGLFVYDEGAAMQAFR